MLDQKLNEELNEYQESKSMEELADLLEVIHAVALARREFNTYRKQKSPEGLEKPLFFCQIFLILVLYVSYVYGIIEKGDFF